MGRLFGDIAEDISRATGLAEAVENRKRHFDPLDVALIRVGENTGELGAIFKMLGDWYSFRQRIKRTIVSGLALPIFIVHFAAFIIPVPQLVLGGWDFGNYFRTVITFLPVFIFPHW
jgi:type II secretory pathway component PulF